MFKHFKMAVSAKLALMVTHSPHLFVADVTKDEMWETYLNSFPEDVRQTYNCNCCRQFIKNYGNVVAIVDGKTVSIWDVHIDNPEHEATAKAMNSLISGKPVRDVFVTNEEHLGVDKNNQLKEDGEVITWEHFYFRLPKSHVTSRQLSTDAVRATYRDNKNVLKRSLDEISLDASDTVLELIAQKSLYRGDEHKSSVTEFRKLKVGYEEVPAEKKDNFCWKLSTNSSMSISRIRNTSIGTLLTDISEGRDLDVAVSAFERIMAPANYKRPNAIITKRMIEEAEKTVKELGIESSLGRRFAISEEVSVNNVLFVDRTPSASLGDVFSELKGEVSVNPKSFSKVEEIGIDDFIKNVVPKSKSIEVLLQNNHSPNLVSLIAPKDAESPALFKWGNNFSWSYNGSVADSLRERVIAAGGRVDGVFRFTHSWNEIEPNRSLMDLHVFMPGCQVPTSGGGPNVTGRRVGWNHRKDAASGGTQDVDYVQEAPEGYIPVENITFPDIEKMPEGVYTCKIHNWSFRKSGGRGRAEIAINGELYEYVYPPTKNHEWITIAEITLKNGQFTINHKLESTSITKKLWGMNTNTFQKVSMIMKSPNYWDDKKVGNEHTFFMLENAHNDDTVRGFFNEFLTSELDKHRKVFEVLGGKMKVEPSHKQLSGLGFSSTTKGELIVKVEGAFTRTLKVKF